jgi:hypothetical protein
MGINWQINFQQNFFWLCCSKEWNGVELRDLFILEDELTGRLLTEFGLLSATEGGNVVKLVGVEFWENKLAGKLSTEFG